MPRAASRVQAPPPQGLAIAGDAPRPQKVSHLIARRIVSDIFERDLPTGTLLAPEHEMLEQLGVGRFTLREALRILESQGVLTMKLGSGGGPVVQRPTSEQFADHLALVLQFDGCTLADVIEAREEFEPMIAAMAARRIGEQDLEELEASIDVMRADPDDVAGYREANWFFHSHLAAVTGNQVLCCFAEAAKTLSDGFFSAAPYGLEQRLSVVKAHARIVDGLRDRDAEQAREAMRRHVSDLRRYLERTAPHVLRTAVRWA